MNAKRYLLQTAFYSLIVVLAVLGLNYVVDPYGVMGTPRIDHLNRYKVDINDHTRLMKKYHPQERAYNALVLGNSRAEMGINPAHPCFIQSNMEVYNLAMPGADVRTQLNYALNLIYQQPVQHIFLSVDFIDFISTESDPGPVVPLLAQSVGELKYLPSGQSNPEYQWLRLMDYSKSLFSLDALISSVKTVLLQGVAVSDRDDAGFNPALDFGEAVRVEGPRPLFDQKMKNLKAKYRGKWYLRNAQGQLPSAHHDIADFLDVAADRGLTVYVFTHPFHQSYWDVMQLGDLMPLYEDWRSAIETLVTERQNGSVRFWDFTVDSPYIHEAFPERGVKSGPLNWFWEPAHYRRELGDLMVEAMLSERCEATVQIGRQVL